ncbi:hypothetical protein KAU92_01000 [Candidatus Bathyarchaeota archaeon]|nr:hypothetical protein [Candidatus Bathyarchaeota archaeon]
MLKPSKFQISVLVLIILTVIYTVALAYDVHSFEKYKVSVTSVWEDYPSLETEFINWKPYWETGQGRRFTSVGFAVAFAWSILVTVKSKAKPLKIGFLSLFLILSLVDVCSLNG